MRLLFFGLGIFGALLRFLVVAQHEVEGQAGPHGLDQGVGVQLGQLDELVLAYATTIHKAQGSEYPVVVIPILMTHYVMLQRNLVYTGVTRAKKLLVIVGTKKALSMAVRNTSIDKRNTLLARRIKESLEK